MSKKQRRKVSLIIGLAAGVFVDVYLRFTHGDEGNLLVHTTVFIGCFLIAAGLSYGLCFVLKR